MKLDIGSGGKSSLGEDWLGVDAYAANADIPADMGNLPFAPDSVDEIYSSHALEHLPMRLVLPTLQEWFRVLKPGGRLTVRVPDLAWCLIQWLTNPNTGFEMMRIFGNQEHEGEFHKCGFTVQILAEAISSAGFQVQQVETIWSHAQQTLSATAIKPAH